VFIFLKNSLFFYKINTTYDNGPRRCLPACRHRLLLLTAAAAAAASSEMAAEQKSEQYVKLSTISCKTKTKRLFVRSFSRSFARSFRRGHVESNRVVSKRKNDPPPPPLPLPPLPPLSFRRVNFSSLYYFFMDGWMDG